MSTTELRPEWQEMRDRGMSVREVARRVGVSEGTVSNHTRQPLPQDLPELIRKRIIMLYAEGKTRKAIAQSTHLTIHRIMEVIEEAVIDGSIDAEVYMAREEPQAVEKRIPVRADDDCPWRDTRGLTEAQYKRLLAVNKEYDRKVRDRVASGKVGGAGYIRDVEE